MMPQAAPTAPDPLRDLFLDPKPDAEPRAVLQTGAVARGGRSALPGMGMPRTLAPGLRRAGPADSRVPGSDACRPPDGYAPAGHGDGIDRRLPGI